MKPYSFKNFWLPFIILVAIMIVATMVTGSTDSSFGVLLIGLFYFYNRGYKNAKKEDG